MPDLTPRQAAMLDYIRGYTTEHGYPPSMEEIGKAVGLSSMSSVLYQLGQLQSKGYIRRDPRKPRAIVVTDHTTAEP